MVKRNRTPTLILHGDPDRVVPVQHGRALARRIQGAEFRVVPGGTHDPNQLYFREAPRVAKFLAGPSGAGK